MSNYVLQLELGDGFNKADSAIDKLLKKVGDLSSAATDLKIDLSGILSSSSAEKQGTEVGKKMGAGVIKGLREVSGKDLAKVFSLGEFESGNKKLDWKKILTGVGLGFTNPYIGSRVLSDELGKKLTAGKEGGIAGGLFGKGGIAGFSEIFLAFKALKLGIDIFKWSVEKFKASVERASQLYSKSLNSGLGLAMTTKRSTLADIMGVSEQDVFRFGAQMAYLNPKIEWATAILAKTAIPLTQLGWEFKVMQNNLSAMAAKIFAQASPAVLKMIQELNVFIKNIDFSAVANAITYAITGMKVAMEDFIFWLQEIGKLLPSISDQQTKKEAHPAGTIFGEATGGAYTNTGTQNKQEKENIAGIDKIGSALGLHNLELNKDNRRIFEMTFEKLNAKSLAAQLKAGGASNATIALAESYRAQIARRKINDGKDNFPSPSSWMKQLPASSWEKMGLVTMGGSQNYQKDIAKNTKEMSEGFKILAAAMSVKRQNSYFGMSSATAQP